MNRLHKSNEVEAGIGVYAIFLTSSPQKAYIGSSKNIPKRIRQHYLALKAGRHKNYRLQGLFKRHGENAFRFLVLDEFTKIEDARSREQELIDFLGESRLYNIDKEVRRYPK